MFEKLAAAEAADKSRDKGSEPGGKSRQNVPVTSGQSTGKGKGKAPANNMRAGERTVSRVIIFTYDYELEVFIIAKGNFTIYGL